MCVSNAVHKKTKPEFLGETVQTAAYILNRTASRTRNYRIPYELWTGWVPTVSHLHLFGCITYVHIPKGGRSKLDQKSKKAIFVGYCTYTKAYSL